MTINQFCNFETRLFQNEANLRMEFLYQKWKDSKARKKEKRKEIADDVNETEESIEDIRDQIRGVTRPGGPSGTGVQGAAATHQGVPFAAGNMHVLPPFTTPMGTGVQGGFANQGPPIFTSTYAGPSTEDLIRMQGGQPDAETSDVLSGSSTSTVSTVVQESPYWNWDQPEVKALRGAGPSGTGRNSIRDAEFDAQGAPINAGPAYTTEQSPDPAGSKDGDNWDADQPELNATTVAGQPGIDRMHGQDSGSERSTRGQEELPENVSKQIIN